MAFLNKHVLMFEFRAIISRKPCTQEKVKSKKKINMADVYTGERGNVNFKTLFILQYTSHVPTKFALINLSIPVDMLYDLTIILSRLIDYRYFY